MIRDPFFCHRRWLIHRGQVEPWTNQESVKMIIGIDLCEFCPMSYNLISLIDTCSRHSDQYNEESWCSKLHRQSELMWLATITVCFYCLFHGGTGDLSFSLWESMSQSVDIWKLKVPLLLPLNLTCNIQGIVGCTPTNVPRHGKSLYKPYKVGIYGVFWSPRISRLNTS